MVSNHNNDNLQTERRTEEVTKDDGLWRFYAW
jgi:hypothetical protein